MISVELRDVQLHAYHGIYQGEETVGSPYLINLCVKYDETIIDSTSVKNTINYVDLYAIIRERMAIATGLLEEVCEKIAADIRERFPFAAEIDVSVYKMQPPIENFQGTVGVTMNKKFND